MLEIKVRKIIPNKEIVIWKNQLPDDWGRFRFQDDEIYDAIIKYFRPDDLNKVYSFIQSLYDGGSDYLKDYSDEDITVNLRDLHDDWLSFLKHKNR